MRSKETMGSERRMGGVEQLAMAMGWGDQWKRTEWLHFLREKWLDLENWENNRYFSLCFNLFICIWCSNWIQVSRLNPIPDPKNSDWACWPECDPYFFGSGGSIQMQPYPNTPNPYQKSKFGSGSGCGSGKVCRV